MTTTTTSNGSTVPVIVSGEDEDDVPIYLRVYRGKEVDPDSPGFYWYVIKTKTDVSHHNDKVFSTPVFKQEPILRALPGCVSVGDTLYVLGGRDSSPPPSLFGFHKLSPSRCDVFYIDTTAIGAGWKKLDHSMNVPRTRPYAFTDLNGKIYVMGGQEGDQPSPKPEVLDTRRMDEGWRELRDSPDVPDRLDGHAVIDGGKRIVVQSRNKPHLYCYDVDADSWQVYLQHVVPERRPLQPVFLDWQSAFLDGILYYLDGNRPGLLFGVDLSRPPRHTTAEPKRVSLPSGLKCEDLGWQWIPQPVHCSDLCLPPTCLVSIGSGKLAVLWYGSSSHKRGELDVYCSTIKMEKKYKEGRGDDFDLVAHPLCLSHVLVLGSDLMDCIPIFPSKKTGPQAHEDVNDSTISANHKYSTGGSNNNKNGSKKIGERVRASNNKKNGSKKKGERKHEGEHWRR